MPNIELHNFTQGKADDLSDADLQEAIDKIEATTRQIFDALDGASYLAEAVVTLVESTSVEQSGKQAPPYLRLWASSQSELDDIIKRLWTLDIGMEVAPRLYKWVEPRSEREATLAQRAAENFVPYQDAVTDSKFELQGDPGTREGKEVKWFWPTIPPC